MTWIWGSLSYAASGSLDSVPPTVTHNITITSLSQQLQLEGSTAQSRRMRHFYPRAHMPGDIVVEGICRSQDEYQQLAYFIRHNQWAILGTPNGNFQRFDNIASQRLLKLDVPTENNHWRGFVKNFGMTKKGVFQPAPTYSFNLFVVWDDLKENIGISSRMRKYYDGGAQTGDGGSGGPPTPPDPGDPPGGGSGGGGSGSGGSGGSVGGFQNPVGSGNVSVTPATHDTSRGSGWNSTGYHIVVPDGTPVYAVEDGKIPHAYPNGDGKGVDADAAKDGYRFAFDGGKISGTTGSVTYRRWFYSNVKIVSASDGSPLRHVIKGQLLGYTTGGYLHFSGSDPALLSQVVGA